MSNVSNWTEGIILSLAFLAIFGIILGAFNLMYSKNYDSGIVDNSNSEALFITYQDTAQTQIKSGEATFDATQGITLKSSWGLAKDATVIVWGFVTGGFIENLAEKLNLGESGMLLAKALRVLYFLSLVFALLYALFKVVL